MSFQKKKQFFQNSVLYKINFLKTKFRENYFSKIYFWKKVSFWKLTFRKKYFLFETKFAKKK